MASQFTPGITSNPRAGRTINNRLVKPRRSIGSIILLQIFFPPPFPMQKAYL